MKPNSFLSCFGKPKTCHSDVPREAYNLSDFRPRKYDGTDGVFLQSCILLDRLSSRERMLQELEDKLKSADIHNGEKDTILETLKTKYDICEITRNELESEVSSLRNEKDTLTLSSSELGCAKEKLENDLSAKTVKVHSLKNIIHERDILIDNLNKELAFTRSEKTDASSKSAEIKRKLDALDARFNDLVGILPTIVKDRQEAQEVVKMVQNTLQLRPGSPDKGFAGHPGASAVSAQIKEIAHTKAELLRAQSENEKLERAKKNLIMLLQEKKSEHQEAITYWKHMYSETKAENENLKQRLIACDVQRVLQSASSCNNPDDDKLGDIKDMKTQVEQMLDSLNSQEKRLEVVERSVAVESGSSPIVTTSGTSGNSASNNDTEPLKLEIQESTEDSIKGSDTEADDDLDTEIENEIDAVATEFCQRLIENEEMSWNNDSGMSSDIL